MHESVSFAARLTQVLGTRRPYPWAKDLGITRGTVNRMLNEGHVPGPDVLARIAQVESCSITWLLTGQGAPYLVHRTDTDAETAERLQAHLADEAWHCHILEDARRGAVVLSLPAQLGEGDEAVRYTAVEIIAGPIGPEAAEVLSEHVEGAVRYGSATIDAIFRGQIGARAALDLIQAGTSMPSDLAAARVAEIAGTYGGGAYSPDEKAWVDVWHRLSPASRAHARAVVNALAQQATDDPGENGGQGA